MTRTVTHLFDDYAQAQRAVEALEQAGFSSSEISLVSRYRSDGSLADDASGAATGATVGGLAGGGVGLLAALGVIAIPGIGPLVAAGVLATTLASAAAGTVAGGLIGALVDYGVSEDDAHVYSEAVRRGALWFRCEPTMRGREKPNRSWTRRPPSTSPAVASIIPKLAGRNTIRERQGTLRRKSVRNGKFTAGCGKNVVGPSPDRWSALRQEEDKQKARRGGRA